MNLGVIEGLKENLKRDNPSKSPQTLTGLEYFSQRGSKLEPKKKTNTTITVHPMLEIKEDSPISIPNKAFFSASNKTYEKSNIIFYFLKEET